MDNANYDCGAVKSICQRKLQIHFRAGKEFNGWFVHEGKKVCRLTVPKGRKHVPPGTYKNMARQLKLKVQEFDKLLDCSLTRQGFISAIKDRSLGGPR